MKNQKGHVVILMSTYNGEKYLEEQLESLLSQKDVIVSIFVRDDGSSDGTHEILNRYNKDGYLEWYSGENLKPAKSFLNLIVNAPNAEYYAFCDQDDYWLPDKLKNAIDKIKDFQTDKPFLYYGCPRLGDVYLNPIKQLKTSSHKMTTFEKALVTSNCTGCTMVFNKKLLEMTRTVQPRYISMHDDWVHKICLALGGHVYFDEDVHIIYRQHGENVIGISNSIKTIIWRHYNSIITHECVRSRTVQSLLECFSDQMSNEKFKEAKLVANYRCSIKDKTRLLFASTKIKTGYFNRDLLYRIAVMLGVY